MQSQGMTNILELGGGQGRDSIFFARSALKVQVLDYSEAGVEAIARKANDLAMTDSITAMRHDIRNPLPFDNGSFDSCFSHMLFSMALSNSELQSLSEEVRRALKAGGLNIYTVRHTNDPHYGTGIHRGEDMYEEVGFIVHFFSEQKVKQLAEGYQIVDIEEFEEGKLPRKLFRVTLRASGDAAS